MIKLLALSFCIFLSLILLSMAGCGFRLRNQNELPPHLHILYLKTANPYGSFETNLGEALRSSGVTLVNSPQSAPITLLVFKPLQTNYSSTGGPSSQARVYIFRYSVTFTLTNASGKYLLKPQTLSTTRNLTLTANQLLQSNNQLSTLEREMQREIINQMYNRLSAEQVFKAVRLLP